MAQVSSITMPSLVGIVCRTLAVDEKCDVCVFFVCYALNTTEFAFSTVIFKIIMIPLHRGRFLVVHLNQDFWDPTERQNMSQSVPCVRA